MSIMDLKKEIGIRLRQFRELLNVRNSTKITRISFADDVGVKPHNIVDYERGASDIPAVVLARLFSMKCNLHWLITGYGLPFFESPVGDTKDEQLNLLAKAGIKFSVVNYPVSPDEVIHSLKTELSLKTFDEGYKQGKKETEAEIIKLKNQIEILLTALALKTKDESQQTQVKDSPKITEMPQKRKFTDISTIENEAEPSPVRVRPRTPKSVTPMKAAATPLVGGTNTNDQP